MGVFRGRDEGNVCESVGSMREMGENEKEGFEYTGTGEVFEVVEIIRGKGKCNKEGWEHTGDVMRGKYVRKW
jgi:hypothetical protein